MILTRKILTNVSAFQLNMHILLLLAAYAYHHYRYMHVVYASDKHAEGSDKLSYGVLSSFLNYIE